MPIRMNVQPKTRTLSRTIIFAARGEGRCYSLKIRNCEICVNPLCFVIELAAIFCLVKAVPFFSGLGIE